MMKVSVGWMVLKDGLPYRPHRSGYSWQLNMTNPPRVYTTKNKAKVISTKVGGEVVELFYEREDG